MHLFAVRCVRQIQHLISDERSLNALDVSEMYAVGNATSEEISAAWDAAWAASWDAALDAAREAWEAARDAQQRDFIAIFCSED